MFFLSLPDTTRHILSCLIFSSTYLPTLSLTFTFFFISTHLAVVVCHREEGDRAAGVAAITDRCHVSIPHDRHGGQRLARGVGMHNGVALPSRRGQLGAQCQVLLYLLVLALVEVELGVFQVAMYLRQQQIIHTLSSLRRIKCFVAVEGVQYPRSGSSCPL